MSKLLILLGILVSLVALIALIKGQEAIALGVVTFGGLLCGLMKKGAR